MISGVIGVEGTGVVGLIDMAVGGKQADEGL